MTIYKLRTSLFKLIVFGVCSTNELTGKDCRKNKGVRTVPCRTFAVSLWIVVGSLERLQLLLPNAGDSYLQLLPL